MLPPCVNAARRYESPSHGILHYCTTPANYCARERERSEYRIRSGLQARCRKANSREPRSSSSPDCSALLLAHPQRRDERLLRNRDIPVFPHPRLALLLLFQQLLLAGDVAAVAL